MPVIECPHCAERVFTISGWADLDRCPNCGRPLANTPVSLGASADLPSRTRTEARRIGPRRPGRGNGRPFTPRPKSDR